MPHRPTLSLVPAFVLTVMSPMLAWSQDLFVERPKPYEGPAPTQQEKNRRESLYRFTYGLLCEKDDRLLEALSAYEEAAKLDPEAAGVFKAQVPILLVLDRPRDALAAVKRVLELDTLDHETWFLAARLHKNLGEMQEYRSAIDKGLATPGLVEQQPHVAQQLYFDLGQHLEASENLPDAIAAYTSSAKILDHPDVILEHGPFVRESIVTKCAETYERIGDLNRKLKRFDAAIAAYRAAQKRNPEVAARINLHLAKLYRDIDAPKDALEAIDGYLRLLPQGTEAYEMKIDLLTRLNRADEILPWLERTAKADALNVNLTLMLARQYAARSDHRRAEEIYLALAEESPNEDIYRDLFRLPRPDNGNFILGQFDKSVRLASKKPIEAGSLRAGEQARAMLTLLKDDAPLCRQMLDAAYQPEQADRDFNYETRYFLAMLADKHGKLGQAERFYRQALDEPGQTNEAPLYSGLLRILWRGRKFEEILRVCERGIRQSQRTNHILFYTDLARAHARLGNFPKAEAAADKSIDIAADRERLFAVQVKIRVLTQAEKYRQAEEICKKLLEENAPPGDIVEVRYLLSGVYSAQKKYELCEAQLHEILKTDPTNATANNDLGYIWADQGKNLKEAEEMIRKAIDLDRQNRKIGAQADHDNAAYVDSLGWVLFRRGDFEGARRELERAVAMPDGDDPTLWDHLGDVYARMGQLVQAQSAYERSVQLYEEERVRAKDERFREVQRKLDQVKTQVRAK